MSELLFTVEGQAIAVKSAVVKVSDTINYFTAKFYFSSDWNGIDAKYAHFQYKGEQYDKELDSNNEIKLGLDLEAGTYIVWLHGAKYDGDTLVKRITTNKCSFSVQKSGMLEGGEPFPSMRESIGERYVRETKEASEKAITASNSASESAQQASSAAASAIQNAKEVRTNTSSVVSMKDSVERTVRTFDNSVQQYKTEIVEIGKTAKNEIITATDQSKTEITNLVKTSKEEIGGLGTQTKTDITNIGSNVKNDISSTGNQLKNEMSNIASHVDSAVETAHGYSDQAKSSATQAKTSETNVIKIQNDINKEQGKIRQELDEIHAIAEGKTKSYVFDSKTQMTSWIASHSSELKVGDVMLIRATDEPDYWWDGSDVQILETTKVDLTDYAKKTDLPKNLSDLASDSAHRTVTDLEKESWNEKSEFSGDYNDLENKPVIPDAVTESTVSGWGFTKNTGTYSKPTGGIPESDLDEEVKQKLNVEPYDDSEIKEELQEIPIRIRFGEPEVLVPEITLQFHKDGTNSWYCTDENPIPGFTSKDFKTGVLYKVIWDGTEYECLYEFLQQRTDIGVYDWGSIGNSSIVGIDSMYGNNNPFCIAYDYHKNEGEIQVFTKLANSAHTLKIIAIPFIRTNDDVIANILDQLFSKNNQRRSDIYKGSGNASIVMNYGMSASGSGSHVEGQAKFASGQASHAEGVGTTASGGGSHAEGYLNTAKGNYSHAEGIGTQALMVNSHSEGEATIANGRTQHVEGAYNKKDTETSDYGFENAGGSGVRYPGKYAHIVGNGTSDAARSNAHTLDWHGNAWFQGDVYVGGTGQDDPDAEKLVKESDLTAVKESLERLDVELETKANESEVYSKTDADAKFLTEHQDVSMFITKAVSDLANYYTKSNTYTKSEVNDLVSAIPKFNILPVDSLPTSDISASTIYLLKTSETETGNLYTEYIYVGNKWEKLGTQTLDLSGYMLKSQLMDAGIKSITWTKNVEGTYTTVEDKYKAQRPAGTNLRYWVEMDKCPYFYHSKMYRVTFNGEVYDNLECRYGILIDEEKGSVIGSDTTVGGAWQMIGNRALYDSRYIDTGEPFAILYVEHGGMHNGGAYYYSSTAGHGILLTKSAMTVNLKIETATITKSDLPHCLDEDFGGGDKLLELTNSTYPRSSWGQGNIVGRGSFAIGNGNISTGQFGIAIGRNNTSKEYCSIAIGNSASATNGSSFAEGNRTNASGFCSHAEGYYTIASGQGSHAEGSYNGNLSTGKFTVTTSSGQGSHAEGCGTLASGASAHAEGTATKATSYESHAEGWKSEATGEDSHAEGLGTYAGSNCQHTQGKWNIKDTSSKYAHIVGNGIAENNRSNAHTLDWDGNAWYQGDVYVGGSGQTDPNAERLMKESDAEEWTFVLSDGTTVTKKVVTV